MVQVGCDRRSKRRLRVCLLVLLCFRPGVAKGQTGLRWTIKPVYESKSPTETVFAIPDDKGVKQILYSESYAVLIVEGNYLNGRWDKVSAPGNRNEILLRSRLESRGFHVMVWKDLTGDQLRTTMEEVRVKLGYKLNSRLFFYFYGHGYTISLQPDPNQKRTFLIPVDAPDPLDEAQFYQTAYPIRDLVNFAENITVKHAFFALEACQAGEIVALITLGDPPQLPHPDGYVLSDGVKRNVRQFLTAGSANEYVLAQSPFTPLLAAALEQGDGYVTGSEVISFVKRRVPQATTGQEPDSGVIPINNAGDFIFGRAAASSAPPRPIVPALPPKQSSLKESTQIDKLPANSAEIPGNKEEKKTPDRIENTSTSIKGSGNVTGTITDPNGSVVPGAEVTLSNLATGWSRKDVTDSSGTYRFTSVPVGTYSVLVKVQGFKDVTRSIDVATNPEISVNRELELAPVSTRALGWAVGYDGTILRTKDCGASWTKQEIQNVKNLNSIAFATPQLGWAVGSKGLIVHTVDGGETWQPQNSGTNENLSSVYFLSKQTGWAVGTAGVMLHTDDGGNSWTALDLSRLGPQSWSNGLESVTFASPESGWVITDYGVLQTGDGGNSWKKATLEKMTFPASIFFKTPRLGWAAGRDADGARIILKTEDGGLTWKRQWELRATKRARGDVRIADLPRSFSSIFFATSLEGWVVGDDSFILHTENGGTDWIRQKIPVVTVLRSVTFATPKLGWAVGDKGIVLYTDDGGTTWKNQTIPHVLSLMGTVSIATN